jgi:hypothetical protein
MMTGMGSSAGQTPEVSATGFDWRVYSDATAAGLTALIPIPLVDLAFEATFRRRMPAAIARARRRQVKPAVRWMLGGGHGRLLSFRGCLALPVYGVRYLLRRLWRKVIYVLAVADAANLVSAYWHRAYLLDHIVSSGHLDEGADVHRSVTVFYRVLREADTSPLVGLARSVVAASGRVGRLLMRARRRGATEATETLASILLSHWGAAEASLRAVAFRYDELYSLDG